MDAQQVADTTFILVQADWPIERAQQFINELTPTHVIVSRSDPQEYYYLYTAQDALNQLAHSSATSTVRDALELHETDATPMVEAATPAEAIPDRCVVLEDGLLVGFFDATVPPPPPRRAVRGGEEAIIDSEAAHVLNRSLVAEFPERVVLGESRSLLVSLETGVATGGIAVGGMPAGTTLDVLVQPRRGFVLEGAGEGQLTLSEGEETESLPLQFKLRSTVLGPGQVRVLAFHGGVALGALTIVPMVVEALASGEVTTPSASMRPLAPVSVRLADLSLLIEEVGGDGQRAFTLRITASDPALNLNLAKYGPVTFRTDPGAYFQEFYKDIDGYALDTETDRAITAQKLADKGTYLFSQLLPAEAQRALWSLKDQITSVLVQSEEPWVPWELCKLCGEDNGEVVEGPFLCEAYAMTRWMPGYGLKPTLTLRNMAIVVPDDSRLPFAPAERAYLLSLTGATRTVTRIPARFLELQQALASGQYDCWHFSGHGGDRSSDPNRSAIYLEGRQTLTPENIVGKVSNLGKATPLVFLNACQIGRGGMSLTDIGGWARQFTRAGAGAFVGAYWSVYDQSAFDFAKELYGRLLLGQPIGQATRDARLAIQASGDPTWLAYTVFADPFATVQA